MDEFVDLLYTLFDEELYNSTLLLAETLYMQTNNIDYLIITLKCLNKLRYHDRVVNFISQNKEINDDNQLKKLYLKAISETKGKPVNVLQTSSDLCTLKSKARKDKKGIINCIKPLNEESMLLYCQAQTEKDIIKYRLLVKSFNLDERNFEALYIIRFESLCDNVQFEMFFNSMKNKNLAILYKQAFKSLAIDTIKPTFRDEFVIFSPFTFLCQARSFYKSKDTSKLFNMAVFMNKHYPKCHISSTVLGLYYLARAQYPEAKKCFYDSITKNNEWGLAWLYFGITLSYVKEGMNSLSSFRNARKYMIGSYKVMFYFAREFSLLNDPESAMCHYKETLQISNNKIVNMYFAIFLLHEERTNELDKVINDLKQVQMNEDEKYVLHMVIVFKYLNEGKIEDAERWLENGCRDWRYYLCRGFCYHLRGELGGALESYHEADINCDEKIGLVQDVMKFAMLGKAEGYGIDIVNYLVDVFDALNLCSLIELPI